MPNGVIDKRMDYDEYLERRSEFIAQLVILNEVYS